MINELGLNEEETEKFLENVRKASFLIYAYQEVEEIVEGELLSLLYQQYPLFEKEERPEVVEMIDGVVSLIGYRLMVLFNALLEGQKAGINIRDKYPDFDRWKQDREELKAHSYYQDPEVNPYPWVYSDEEWRQKTLADNAELERCENWESWRKYCFVDAIQSIILDAYEELYELNPDEWLMYEITMDNEYDDYITACADLELFIDMGLDKDEFEQLDDKYNALDQDEKNRISELQSSRLKEMITREEPLVKAHFNRPL